MNDEPTIICGVSGATTDAELAELLGLGAGELYAGYVPPRWFARLGAEVSPNRRYVLERQVADLEELRRLARGARAYGAQFLLALNEHGYPGEADALVDEIVAAGQEVGANGFIVADPALLDRLARSLPTGTELVASCEAGAYNAATARELAELGATRLIFPREMRLDEMGAIVGALQSRAVEFEAFVAREYCVNSSAVCFATHGYGQRSHFCSAHTRRRLVDLTDHTERDISLAPPGWSGEPSYLAAVHALHRCGLCALDTLRALGVRYWKVPGRSDSALPALRLVRRLLDGGDLSPDACRRLVASPPFCASGENCYYRPRAVEPGRATSESAPAPLGSRPPAPPAPASNPPALAVSLSPGVAARGALDGLLSGDGLAPWERAALDETLEGLRALGAPVDRAVDATPARVYLDLGACALRLPRPAALVADLRALRSAGAPVTLVAPVAFQTIWDDLLALIDAAFAAPVLADDAAPDELVVNDLGLLAAAAGRWPARLAVGRLLNRMKRDPFAVDAAVLPVADGAGDDDRRALRDRQRAAYGAPLLTGPFWEALFRRRGVARVEWDTLPTPITAPLSGAQEGPLGHTLHAPWAYVTSARPCPTTAAVEGAVSSWPTERCRRSCERFTILPDYPWRHRRIVQRGTATFLDVAAHVVEFARSADPPFDRVVIHPRVPL